MFVLALYWKIYDVNDAWNTKHKTKLKTQNFLLPHGGWGASGVPLGILGSGFRHGIHKATTCGLSVRPTSPRRWLCGWQRVPLSLTQRYPKLQWVVASAANYYKVGDKRPPCRFLHFIPKRGRLSKRHPLSHFRACRLKMSKWCVNVLVFNCKSVNRKFFFTPLARICNPCYDIMARIATNGLRPTGDKSAPAK